MSDSLESLLYQLNDVTLQSFIVQAMLYGIYTVIVSMTLWGAYAGRRGKERSHWMPVITVVMYLLSTVYLALSWYMVRFAFITQSSTFINIGETLAGAAEWFRVSGATVFAVNTLIADCTFIWRCWIVWGKNWLVVVLPILITVVGTVFSALSLWQKALPDLSRSKLIQFGTPYFATSLATTGLVTLLIVFRILAMSPKLLDNIGESNKKRRWRPRYFSTIEIIVESAALYSLTLLIFLILFTRDNLNYVYAEQILGVLTGLAPTLILARVSLGFSRPASSWHTGSNVTAGSLHFSPPQLSTIGDGHCDATPESSEAEENSGGLKETEMSWHTSTSV